MNVKLYYDAGWSIFNFLQLQHEFRHNFMQFAYHFIFTRLKQSLIYIKVYLHEPDSMKLMTFLSAKFEHFAKLESAEF